MKEKKSKVKANMKIEYKRPSELEYKTFPFEVKSFREDENYFYFEGYLSTFGNEDRGKDVVVKGAFIESLKEHDPSLLWSHKSGDPPLGVFDSLAEDDFGLYIKARMPKEDIFVKKRIMPQMKIGSIKSMSIGYSIMGEDGAEYSEDGLVRLLKRLFLWEGSLVTIPMNERATVKTKAAIPFQEGLPIADRTRKWDSVLAVGRIRDFTGAEDGGLEDPEVQTRYKKAFLWFDEENPDLFGAYKMPIVDIIDGRPQGVPRAIFAAAAALQGARGGVFLPSEDRPRVLRTVEKYYEKMGLESPFGKTFRIDDFAAMPIREMEKLFHGGVRMSKKSSEMLVTFVKKGLSGDHSTKDKKGLSGDHSTKDKNGGEPAKEDWSSVLDSLNVLNKQVNGEK
jgi:HK97 family phage prohead protease